MSRVQQNRKKLRMTGAKTYEGTHATKKIIKKNLEKYDPVEDVSIVAEDTAF